MATGIEYVFFNADISEKNSVALLQELQAIKQEEREPRIILSSSGGGTTHGFLIHDQIGLHWPDIVIIGSGTIQSAALDVFFAAKPQNRYVTKHCSMFFHEMYCNKKGKKITFSKGFSQLSKDYQEEFLIERNFGYDIFKNATGFSKKLIERLEKEETWLTSKQIVKSGFASKIITSLDEIAA